MKAEKFFKKAICFMLVLSLTIPAISINTYRSKQVQASESDTAKPLKYKYESVELNLAWESTYTFKLPWGNKAIKSVKFSSKIWEEKQHKMIKQTASYKSMVSYKVLGKRKMQFTVSNKQAAIDKNLPLSDNGSLRNGIMVVLKLKGGKKYRIRINLIDEYDSTTGNYEEKTTEMKYNDGTVEKTETIAAKDAVTDEGFKKRSTKPKAVSKLESPKVKKYTSVSGVMLEWDRVDNAVSYDVYRKHGKNGKWKKVGKVKECDYIYRYETVRQFVDISKTGYNYKKTYNYKVVAKNRKTSSKEAIIHVKKHQKQKNEAMYDALYWINYYKKKYSGTYIPEIWNHDLEKTAIKQLRAATPTMSHVDPLSDWSFVSRYNPATEMYDCGSYTENPALEGLYLGSTIKSQSSKSAVSSLLHSPGHMENIIESTAPKYSNTTWNGGVYGNGNTTGYHETLKSAVDSLNNFGICSDDEDKITWFYPENTWVSTRMTMCVISNESLTGYYTWNFHS